MSIRAVAGARARRLWSASTMQRTSCCGTRAAAGACTCRPKDDGARAMHGAGFGHDFSRVPTTTPQRPRRAGAANATAEADDVHRPLVDEFRRREGGLGNPAGGELGEGEIKYRGLAGPCPARTEVERVVTMTPAGLRDGFLTAYGAMTVMRVRPGERTWDGTRIRESLSTVSNTCPPTFAPTSECIGDSTFTVGEPGHSSRIGDQPGLVNRFYDFHVSRTRGVSRLHDAARNPGGLPTCQTVCEQRYFCNDREIGRHTITRVFTKGTYAGRDVTLVDVTKM